MRLLSGVEQFVTVCDEIEREGGSPLTVGGGRPELV